jgi:hypothetical protein
VALSIIAIAFGLMWVLWVRYVFTPRRVPRVGRPISAAHLFWVTRAVPFGFIVGGVVGVVVTGLILLA